MKYSLLKWIVISTILHALVIVSSSVLPLLISLGMDSPTLEHTEVSLTEDVYDFDDESNEKHKDLIINKDSLNIDVVKVSQVNKLFLPEVANEVVELIKIYKGDKLQQEKTNKELVNLEIEKAKTGVNVINTYPLGVHAKVILDNLDFTTAFDVEISFRVNSDGSFRAIEMINSSGFDLVDRSLENIFKELSNQKIAFLTSFRRMNVLMDSDGEDLTLTVRSYLKDSLQASSIYFLLNSVLSSSKSNNKTDEETMTILNNLVLTKDSNAIIINVNVKSLFVRDAIKD